MTEGKTGERGTKCQEKAETSMGGVGLEEREAEVSGDWCLSVCLSEIGGIYPQKMHIDRETMGNIILMMMMMMMMKDDG